MACKHAGRAHRIAVTGGSCSGKSTFCSRLATRFADRVHLVDEVATRIMRSNALDQERLDHAGRRALQLAIYRTQLELEHAAPVDKLLVVDRGTVDAAAYWPEGPEDFWCRVGSSLCAELDRYDSVIWLESGAHVAQYERTVIRTEFAAASRDKGMEILALWRPHRRLVVIPALEDFEEKWARFLQALESSL